jgi:hypothetical protein
MCHCARSPHACTPKSTATRRDPDDQDRATSNGLVMLEQTARDAFCRTACPRMNPRVDTPTWRCAHQDQGFAHPFAARPLGAPSRAAQAPPQLVASCSCAAAREGNVALARSAKDASGRLLQPTCQRRAPALRVATPGSPRVSRAVHAPESRFRPVSRASQGLVLPVQRRCHRTSGVPVIADLEGLAPTSTSDQVRFPRRPVKADTLPRTETPSIDAEGFRPFEGPRLENRSPFLDPASPLAVSRARLDRHRRLQPQPEPLPTTRHRLPTSATNHEGRARPANDHSSNGPRLARCPWLESAGCPDVELRAAESKPSAGRTTPREHAHCDAEAHSS